MDPPADTAVEVFATADLPGSVRSALHWLFDQTYAQADHGYLDKSLELLRFAAIAVTDGTADEGARRPGTGGDVIGFAIGETRTLDLPGLPGQQVGLAGLCCVHSAFRRRGLFHLLEQGVIVEGMRRLDNGRLLTAGRMAHPASMRIMRGSLNRLPRPGVMPTPFQQSVARGVAACYSVTDFDPRTFVCRGHGRPVGYPRMEIEAQPRDWELFRNVDRDRGDSLLALSWIPDAPPGW